MALPESRVATIASCFAVRFRLWITRYVENILSFSKKRNNRRLLPIMPYGRIVEKHLNCPPPTRSSIYTKSLYTCCAAHSQVTYRGMAPYRWLVVNKMGSCSLNKRQRTREVFTQQALSISPRMSVDIIDAALVAHCNAVIFPLFFLQTVNANGFVPA